MEMAVTMADDVETRKKPSKRNKTFLEPEVGTFRTDVETLKC
jgi:hypothetical protein